MSIQFIAVLDHHHLENTLFLNSFAKSLAKLGDRKGLVIHGDSPYTDRLIQTGMMREDARMRAIKDLNKRLVGLFADQGIATIGIHAFQKGLVRLQDGEARLHREELEKLHATPNLLVSNLVEEDGEAVHYPLPEFTRFLASALEDVEVLLFSRNEKDEILTQSSKEKLFWKDLPKDFEAETLPEEFANFGEPVKITTASELANWPKLGKVTTIE